MQDDDEHDDELDDHSDDDNNTAAMLEAWDTVGLEGVSLDDYISADDNIVVTDVLPVCNRSTAHHSCIHKMNSMMM